MKLLADGIYMSLAFERFSLVEEIYQLVHLPSVVEALFYVKKLISHTSLYKASCSNTLNESISSHLALPGDELIGDTQQYSRVLEYNK
ncbi:hypothetical protein J3Q64DRAFT_1169726 [Phycomyces blakesleeanus]|uniref:Uncharacterized protein n=1 Tax=Phycomyces blakesleeanus TaxID=4837 RepID=A0ABR3AU69_PHYBL